jgi:putative methionine-R-sulfoxide reductase with GAF domain
VPIINGGGSIFGVFDIDSPVKNRFTEQDKETFEEIVDLFKKACNI